MATNTCGYTHAFDIESDSDNDCDPQCGSWFCDEKNADIRALMERLERATEDLRVADMLIDQLVVAERLIEALQLELNSLLGLDGQE